MRLQSGMNSERQHRWCRRIANLKGGLMPRRWLTQASGGITTRFELSILPATYKAQCLLGPIKTPATESVRTKGTQAKPEKPWVMLQTLHY